MNDPAWKKMLKGLLVRMPEAQEILNIIHTQAKEIERLEALVEDLEGLYQDVVTHHMED